MVVGILGFFFSIFLTVIILSSEEIKSIYFIYLMCLCFAIILALASIFLILITSIFWCKIVLDEEGLKIINRRKRIRRSINWCDVNKFVVSQAEPENDMYICLTSNDKLSPIYTHMYGIINAPIYDKKTISIPAQKETILFCATKLSKYGITMVNTGLAKNCPTNEMKETLKNKKARNNIVSIIISALMVLGIICLFAVMR